MSLLNSVLDLYVRASTDWGMNAWNQTLINSAELIPNILITAKAIAGHDLLANREVRQRQEYIIYRLLRPPGGLATTGVCRGEVLRPDSCLISGGGVLLSLLTVTTYLSTLQLLQLSSFSCVGVSRRSGIGLVLLRSRSFSCGGVGCQACNKIRGKREKDNAGY